MSFDLLETDVRRAWTALRFVDAMSLRTVEAPLRVELTGARLARNRSGLYVVAALDRPAVDLDALRDYENAFDSIPAVIGQALQGSVADPAGRYLPRRFGLALPRSPLAPDEDSEAPLFEAVTVVLDPSPATPLLPTWAALRLTIRHAGAPVAQAAIRVQRPDGTPLGRGLTDARGQALVAVVGVAQVTPGDGELVVEREIAADVIVSVDTTLAAAAVIDPDALAAKDPGPGLARLVERVALASGRIETLTLTVP